MTRKYVSIHESFWYRANESRGFYLYTDGDSAEISVEWPMEGSSPTSAKINAFNDGWETLKAFMPIFEELGDCELTPDEFEEVLKSHGVIDETQRERPDEVEKVTVTIPKIEAVRLGYYKEE